MPKKELLEDICILLNNCANCKTCAPTDELKCYSGLIITTPDTFYIEPYEEKTNAKLIKIAEQHGYKAGIITKGDYTYLQFTAKES